MTSEKGIRRREFLSLAVKGTALGAAMGAGLVPAIFPTAASRAFGREPGSGKFHGVVSVLVTPNAPDGSVDPDAMTDLCRHISAAGVDGVFAAGSTGDMGLLSIPERESIIAAARAGIKPEQKIYAGVSDYFIPQIIDNAKRFADVGADVGVVMAPMMFFTYSQAEMVAYFREIADKSVLPVLLYHHVRVSTPIEVETIKALASHPNIIGMKETGATMERTREILQAVKGEDFIFMQGNEPFIAESFPAGCDGVLSALAGVWPELFVTMNHAFRSGDTAQFKSMTDRLSGMCEVFKIMPRGASFSYFGWTMKRMLVFRDWLKNANVRMPGFVVDPQWEKQLVDFLREKGFPTA